VPIVKYYTAQGCLAQGIAVIENKLQAFLDFCGFNFRGFQFASVYNSIICSSPLVLLSNLDIRGFCFRGFSFGSPH
jgi:hypothetical protein